MPEFEKPADSVLASQADILAENDALKARLAAIGAGPGPSPELTAALARAATAEARVAALEKQLVEVEASVVRRAGMMAAAQVAAAGITRTHDHRGESKPASGGQTATEKALAARKAAGLKDTVTV
jgi:hypothetical protein